MLTQEYLKSILEYNKSTGAFTWRCDMRANKIKGKLAGTLVDRYLKIKIKKRQYSIHRLAWLYVYGSWPKNQIDHINGDKLDNRIENLRDVTSRQNSQNCGIHRNGKLVGASFHKQHQRWRATVYENGKCKHLGLYDSELEAHNKYKQYILEKKE